MFPLKYTIHFHFYKLQDPAMYALVLENEKKMAKKYMILSHLPQTPSAN